MDDIQRVVKIMKLNLIVMNYMMTYMGTTMMAKSICKTIGSKDPFTAMTRMQKN